MHISQREDAFCGKLGAFSEGSRLTGKVLAVNQMKREVSSMKKFQFLKRGAALCLTLCMIAGILSGCGGNSGTNDAGSGASQADKDTLTVALTDEPDYLSTCDQDSLMGVQMNLLTYNGLMRIDMETLEPVCDLAESYTQAQRHRVDLCPAARA